MNENPYAPPKAPVADSFSDADPEYAGFWIRVAAALIDGVLIIVVTFPLLLAIYGTAYFTMAEEELVAGTADFLISYVAPAVATILFWWMKQATPGKMMLSLRIVDANSGEPISMGQAVGRYFGYIPSILILGLGFIWVAFDARKQGWHDKIAGVVVIRSRR
jgi:uncharacterized RDD family membrane protein YckC